MDELTGLLIRARDGDKTAFTAVVRTLHPHVRRLCAHLVGREDADDATQEAFLAAWQSLASFRADASARTWLFVIARRSADRVALRRRRWLELADQAPRPAASSRPETVAELDALMSELDADRRVALVLTQVIGLTYAEAAEVCECPVGTIRSRVARAREELLGWRSARPAGKAPATSWARAEQHERSSVPTDGTSRFDRV